MKWGVVVSLSKDTRQEMVIGSYLLGIYNTKSDAQDVADFHNTMFPEQHAEVKKGGRYEDQ